MGLFDKLLGSQTPQNVTLTKEEAFLGVLLMTIAADGEITEEEVASLAIAANRMQLLKHLDGDDVQEIFRKIGNMLKKEGFESVIKKAADSLTPEMRQTVFAQAADLIFADGTVEDGEKAVIEAIQKAMQVPDDLAMKIIEVLSIKNRG